MTSLAMDLNDAGLVLVRDGAVHAAGPACAALVGGELRFGTQAAAMARLNPRLANRRYWAELGEAPLPAPLGDCRSPADLVHRHLQWLWSDCGGADAVVLAVMPGWSLPQLGLLLGIAREIGMPVTGLVDPAVAASRRPWPGRALWNLHVGLHAATVSRIRQEPGAALGEPSRVERVGLEPLERGCAEFLARRFVECARFDPLHAAAGEQQLDARLPEWLAAAARQERVSMALEHGGNRFEAWFDATDLRRHVARLVEPLTQRLRTRMSPREPSVLQVPARLADFPGLVEALTRLPACTVVLLEPAAVARGALRTPAAPDAAAGVSLTTALPWDQPAEEAAGPALPAAGLTPTHVAFEGRAWRLGPEPFHIGTEIGEHEHGLRLDARSQAVSRRHCAIQVEGGRAVVHDQSRYGTRLNGHRIEGSAVLQAGDVLGVGEPPREFALLAEVSRGA